MFWLTMEVFVLMLATTAIGMMLGVGVRRGLGAPVPAGVAAAHETGPAAFAPDEEDEAGYPAATGDDGAAPGDRPAGEAVAVTDAIIDPDRAASADQVGVRPDALAGPRGGAADDLKRIRGIGPQNEARLNALGIFHFGQIAAWSADEARWVGTYLAFPGRIERERWVEQAGDLAAGAGPGRAPDPAG